VLAFRDVTATLPSAAGFLYDPPEVRSGRILKVSEPQLSVRSAKARDLARRLARREHRSIADVVERALEAYEIREAGREPASVFYARLANDYGSDLDLAAVIRENRTVNPGPEL
jgi:Rv0623-like transcription factor